MSARRISLVFVLYGSLSILGLLLPGGTPAATAHHVDGHLLANYFVSQFTENVPSNPFAFISIYDCAGQGHTHPSAISGGAADWNNTGRVKFYYQPGATTTCQADGFPVPTERISVKHYSSTEVGTADYFMVLYNDSSNDFRDNDIGLEGDVGMYPVAKGRVRLGGFHDALAMRHELGHATGLADLYGGPDPCPHVPDTTIMDCNLDYPWPAPHDLDNLDLLYKKAPEQVTDFQVSSSSLPHSGGATINFAWTDKSYTELTQYVWMDNDLNGIGEGFPLATGRDIQAVSWTGLEPETQYCFFIQAKNAYEIYGPKSATVCHMTPTPPLPSTVYLTSTFPTTATNRITWTHVPGYSHYHVCSGFSPSGSFTACSGSLLATSYDTTVPLQDGVQWYNKVKVCNDADQCTLSADWTLTQRVDVNGWKYAFTYYRTPADVRFQFINFMDLGGAGQFALSLHVKNGTAPTSPNVYQTACIPVNQVSPLESISPALLTALVVGTVGHDILSSTACDSGHTNDSTNARWGYLQPPSPPASVTSTFPNISTNQFGWSAVAGVDHYHYCTNNVLNGSKGNCGPPITATSVNAAVPTQDRVPRYSKVKACNVLDSCGDLSLSFGLTERVNVGGWNYAFTHYREGSNLRFQFINFMSLPPIGDFALSLHLRNGALTSSTLVTDTACIQVNNISALMTMSADSFFSGVLGTQGHDILSATQCDSGHTNDSPYIGSGSVPP